MDGALEESNYLDELLQNFRIRNQNEPEFIQAVEEVLSSVRTLIDQHPDYLNALPSLLEPDRLFTFKIYWTDRNGTVRVNRGFRVQFNNALGVYKGGLRFHPTVNASIIKFLGFEQIFKNALTGLAMGGGKGGSDFDPKGKTESEIRSFCQGFMTQLHRHIGANIDVPAGDIGVGSREIGYLLGQYKQLQFRHEGVLTGKPFIVSGSLIRPEATGYGLIYLLQHVVTDFLQQTMTKRFAAISGSGNVALFAAEKLLNLGVHIRTMSDSGGTLLFEGAQGMSQSQLELLKEIKEERGGRCAHFIDRYQQLTKKSCKLDEEQHSNTSANTCANSSVRFCKEQQPWELDNILYDFALPCATQNEIDEKHVGNLMKAGCVVLAEGANMPITRKAVKQLKSEGIIYLPGKAANAGGVAVSGLEMAQNAARTTWTRQEVDNKLQNIMHHIYTTCKETAEELGKDGDFELGANIAAFKKVVQAMQLHGYC